MSFVRTPAGDARHKAKIILAEIINDGTEWGKVYGDLVGSKLEQTIARCITQRQSYVTRLQDELSESDLKQIVADLFTISVHWGHQFPGTWPEAESARRKMIHDAVEYVTWNKIIKQSASDETIDKFVKPHFSFLSAEKISVFFR